jgi:hypothetical protein
VYCAAAVQKDLAKVKFQKAIIDADKLRDAKEEFRYSTDKFTAAKNELKDHDRTVLDNNSALINAHKAFQDYQNKAKTDSAYKSEVVSVGKQIVHLKRDRERLIAKGVRDALIAAVTDWEKKEKDAKEQVTILQNPGQSLKEIGLEEAGKNLDIQRAFAVKIQEEFAALKTGGWNIGGALGKGARAVATSNPVKNVAKDLGEIALATGFFSGAAYGAAAYTATISAPTAGLLVGGAVLTAKVYQKLKKWTIG